MSLPDWHTVQRQLVAAGLEPAPREGFFLLEAAQGDEARLGELLARRLAGEPLAYVVGMQPFWSRDWQVTPAVLIPRPDSEVLVQAVLEVLPHGAEARVAEVGLGSGALLGSVLLERPLVQGVGIELVPETLALARENLHDAELSARATLLPTNLLDGVVGDFTVIFSNPPYLSEAEYLTLDDAVRAWEPKTALVAGSTGLECYQALLPQAWERLRPGGWLMVEIGHTQGIAVQRLLQQQGFGQVACRQDLAGRDRVVVGQK